MQQAPGAQGPAAASMEPDGEPPLWQPWYGVDFKNAVIRYFKKYATFNGRASRSEYWWSCLFIVIVGTALSSLGDLTGEEGMLATIISGMTTVFVLATIIPSLAIAVRRAHDSNKSGYVVLGYSLLEAFGAIAVFLGILGAAGPMLIAAVGGVQSDVFANALGGMVIALVVGAVAMLASAIWALVVNVSKPDPAGARFDKPITM